MRHSCSLLCILQIEAASITHRYGALDNHHGVGGHIKHQIDNLLYMCSIEIVLYGVVVGGCCDHHEVGILISRLAIKSSSKVEFLLCQIFLYIIVLYRRDTIVKFLHLFKDYIHCRNMMVLSQQYCYTQTDVACTGYGYFNVFEIVHCRYIVTFMKVLLICI